MHNELPNSKNNFLYPKSPYRGYLTNETVIFNAKFQEFAQKLGFIANLHTGGKLSSDQAYLRVESLWSDLESSTQGINLE